MKKLHIFIVWLLLNLGIIAGMDLALFEQTTPKMKNATFWEKLKVTEFWATVQWLFIIPANLLANTFLSVPQIALSSFFFDFLGQIISNNFWLNIPTTIDDYIAMILFMFALYMAKYRVLG